MERKKYAIRVKNVTKNYMNGKNIKQKVFKNFSIDFEEGAIHCILGVSGCGKSTLLKMIAGLENVDLGEIDFSKKINQDSMFLSMILQENNLLPWLTVYQNIKFCIESSGVNYTEEEIDNILKQYNLYEFKKFYPYELSVGLKQKVALCKTIMTKPKIILLDEPFCALDFISKENIHKLFINEFSKEQFTSILSTHYLEEAVVLGDYIHLLGKDNKYFKIKNPLKKPRNKDKSYSEFLELIKDKYREG